jgi:hypothetical protein
MDSSTACSDWEDPAPPLSTTVRFFQVQYLVRTGLHQAWRARRSAGFQPAVSRISNPPAVRKFRACRLAKVCRMEFGETADWKFALPDAAERSLMQPCRPEFMASFGWTEV